MMLTERKKRQMVEHFMDSLDTQDFLNFTFMKPFEVALRTHKNDKLIPAGSLPRGLMMAVKSSINDNKYQLQQINPIEDEDKSLSSLKDKHLDNYISLLKKPKKQVQKRKKEHEKGIDQICLKDRERRHKGLELAICISIKSESKHKLKRTLAGVAENIDELIRSGVSPDDICVVVMVDGISNLHSSIFQYLQQIERLTQTYLQDDQKLTLRKKYEQKAQQIRKDQPLNFRRFLFDKQQLAERMDSKLANIRKTFDSMHHIKASIQNLRKEDQNNNMFKVAMNKLTERKRKLSKISDKLEEEEINEVITEDAIMKELADNEQECNLYLNTRQQLAYVCAYRVHTFALCEDCKLQKMKLGLDDLESQVSYSKNDNERIGQPNLRQTLNLNQDSDPIAQRLRYTHIFFCVQYKESGKASSHNWFLNGFCQQLNPRYVVLLDAGVKPGSDAIFKMYRHMKVNKEVGAVCGYLRQIRQKAEEEQAQFSENIDCVSRLMLKVFDIQRAQQIQAHYDSFLDKAFQACFKYVHVVPQSFSAYRMKALPLHQTSDNLFKSYFMPLEDKIIKTKLVSTQFTACSILARVLLPRALWQKLMPVDRDSQEQMLIDENFYSSHSRVLCLGVLNNGKDITFLPNVYAKLYPANSINSLMERKKGEINGGNFSLQKAESEFETISKTKFTLRLQFLYQHCIQSLIFFAPVLFLFALQIACQMIQKDFFSYLNEPNSFLANLISTTFYNSIIFIYSLSIFAIFFFSLHLNAKQTHYLYSAHLAATLLGIIAIIVAVVLVVQYCRSLFKGESYLQNCYLDELSKQIDPQIAQMTMKVLRLLFYCSLLMIYLPALAYGVILKKWGIMCQILAGTPSYIFYFPSYACMLPIYSQCRIDEVYPPQQNKAKKHALQVIWKTIKMVEAGKQFIWNMIVGVVLLYIHNIVFLKIFVALILLATFALLSLLKWIPSVIFIIQCRFNNNAILWHMSEGEKRIRVENMQLSMYKTVRRFQEQIVYGIEKSFYEAADEEEVKDLESTNRNYKKKSSSDSLNSQPGRNGSRAWTNQGIINNNNIECVNQGNQGKNIVCPRDLTKALGER